MTGRRRIFPISTRTRRVILRWLWRYNRPPAHPRHGPVWPALLACGWLVASPGWAAEDGLLTVEPDRPDISNSTHTILVRALQVELGLEYARSHNDLTARRLALQTTLRTGLSGRLELRLDSEPLLRLQEDSDDVGLGNIALGVKYRVFEPPGGTA